MGTEKRKSRGLSPRAPQYFKVREIWRIHEGDRERKSRKEEKSGECDVLATSCGRECGDPGLGAPARGSRWTALSKVLPESELREGCRERMEIQHQDNSSKESDSKAVEDAADAEEVG